MVRKERANDWDGVKPEYRNLGVGGLRWVEEVRGWVRWNERRGWAGVGASWWWWWCERFRGVRTERGSKVDMILERQETAVRGRFGRLLDSLIKNQLRFNI